MFFFSYRCDNKGIGIYKGTSCPLSRSILAVFFILTLFIVSLCTITLVLARKVRMLGRRPRIKKRIVVNKSITPLTSCRPPEQNQQCEITIENCCNMNICETVTNPVFILLGVQVLYFEISKLKYISY